MQSYSTTTPSRNATNSAGIDSKVSAKAGKIPSTPSVAPVDAGNKGGPSKGFKGALINPKIKC